MSSGSVAHLISTPDGFSARVVAARLEAAGIPCLLRGLADTLYPVGAVDVEVRETDLDVARELLLVDEVESVFDTGS